MGTTLWSVKQENLSELEKKTPTKNDNGHFKSHALTCYRSFSENTQYPEEIPCIKQEWRHVFDDVNKRPTTEPTKEPLRDLMQQDLPEHFLFPDERTPTRPEVWM